MQPLLKVAAALLGAFVAFGLAARYPGVATAPHGVALIAFVSILIGLMMLTERRDADEFDEPGGAKRSLSALARRQRPAAAIRRAVFGLLAWGVILVGVGVIYDQRAALSDGARRLLSALQPGYAVALSPGEAVVARGFGGHFSAVVDIGDRSVWMLVDTGSTDVALPYEEAERLGLDVAALSFDHEVVTANGSAKVALVTLDSIRVGSIELRDVRASIAAPGRLKNPLLGMSFLGRLSEVSFAGDMMTLKL